MYFKTLKWHRLLNDEPGADGVASHFDPEEAFEAAGEKAAKAIAELGIFDDDLPPPDDAPVAGQPQSDTPPVSAEDGQEPSGVEAASLPSAPEGTPTPAPAAEEPPSWWKQQQQQQLAIQQQYLQMLQQQQQQQAQKPKPEEKKASYAEGWVPPKPDDTLTPDENTARYLQSFGDHIADRARQRAIEDMRAQMQQQMAPLVQWQQQQAAERQRAEYEGALDKALSSAGYAKGTKQYEAVRDAVHGHALFAHSQRQVVDEGFLARKASQMKSMVPPSTGPQGVVQDAGEPTPVSGSAPAGTAPSAPPTAKAGGSKDFETATEGFMRDWKRVSGGG